MNIVYKDIKELPNDQLHDVFVKVGWSDGQENDFLSNNFNAPFKNSTLVLSAWDEEKLVGCIRVISDKIVRSIIQDFAVLPEYQGKGIGTELLKRCLLVYPKSEWLVPTIKENISYYEKRGFKISNGIFLTIPSQWF